MALSIKDGATEEAVRRLARLRRKSLTQTIREAVDNEYQRARAEIPLPQRLQKLADRYGRFPLTGNEPDEAFFDDLSGGI